MKKKKSVLIFKTDWDRCNKRSCGRAKCKSCLEETFRQLENKAQEVKIWKDVLTQKFFLQDIIAHLKLWRIFWRVNIVYVKPQTSPKTWKKQSLIICIYWLWFYDNSEERSGKSQTLRLIGVTAKRKSAGSFQELRFLKRRLLTSLFDDKVLKITSTAS